MHTLARFLGLRISYLFLGSGSGRWSRMAPPVVPEGYDVKMVDLEDLLPYVNSVPDLTETFLQTAFRRGDVCVASFCGSELAGFSFRSTSRASLTDQLDITVPPGFTYTYKTWISADHRQRNLSQIQGYVRHHAIPKDHGARGIWFVETHNYPSLLHSYRYPSDRALIMGFIGWITIFGYQLPITTRRARWLGVDAVRSGQDSQRSYVL